MFHAPHVPHQQSVGGTLPGYAGHRPLAVQTHGETAWGGVPHHMDEAVPGQGLSLPRTTAFEEIGQPYKPHTNNRTETFREAVGGIKVGYGGHVPGEKNHFGSNHQGKLARVEYEPRVFQHGSAPRPPSSGQVRQMEFEPAWHLAQATGTAKQLYEVGHGSGKSAPFGLDSTNAPYITEQSRPNGAAGPRGQQLSDGGGLALPHAASGPTAARGGVLSEFDRLQRAAAGDAAAGGAARELYNRDVNGRREAGVSPFVYDPSARNARPTHSNPLAVGNAMGNPDLTSHPKSASIGLQHSAHPANRGGSRLDQFINGAGEMDDWIDEPHRGFPPPPEVSAARAQQARRPSHAYENERPNPSGSYHLSHMGIEREAASPPPSQQGAKYRSRIGGDPLGQAPPSPTPFGQERAASPQPTGGGNPFSSRLFSSPQPSQRGGTPRSAGMAGGSGMRGAGSGVDQVRLYGGGSRVGTRTGSRAGSRAGTPPATPPLTPTGSGGAHGRPTGTRYAYSDPRGTPPQPQSQQRPHSPVGSHGQHDWRGVPAVRGDYWGGGARPASPRAWRREEPSSALYEA